jgi:hypothetical protein
MLLQVYSRVADLPSLVKLFETYLEDYNATSTSPMRLVMFLDAIEHVSRLCRWDLPCWCNVWSAAAHTDS